MFLVHWDRQEVYGGAVAELAVSSSWTFLNVLKGRVSCAAPFGCTDTLRNIITGKVFRKDDLFVASACEKKPFKMAVEFSSSIVWEQKYFPSFY